MQLYIAFSFLLLTVCTVTADTISKAHTIEPPYIDDALQNRWFDFGGNTVINTNHHIRLTSTKQSQLGYLWSRVPLNGDNYQIEFEFKVHGDSGHLYGDGFAMWLTKQRMTPGPVFGSADRFEGLGLMFDTYDNERAHRHSFPYVMAMLGDGMQSYDNDKDGRPTELVGCEADFRKKGFPTRARLTYHKNNYLQLELVWRNEDKWEECFKHHNVRLPPGLFLGFSAHTGEVTDNHDIISVVTRTLQPAVKEEVPLPEKKKVAQKSNGSVFSVVFKMVLAAGILGVLYMGYRFYDQKSRMKRF